MKIMLKDVRGAELEEVELSFSLIEDDQGLQAVHEAVVAFQAAQRHGSACSKTRSEVAGSGKKPWRQKGTGRARAGSVRSPIWRGGGVAFGPRPRDFRKKIPRRVRKLAFRKAVSDRLKDGSVVVVDSFAMREPKTSELLRRLRDLELKGSTLIVTAEVERSVVLSARNLPYVEIMRASDLNPYALLKYHHLLLTRSALDRVAQRMKDEGPHHELV